jgi:hypothetical protein
MSARRENTHHARSEKRPVNRMDVSHRHFAKNRETRRARENASGFKEPDVSSPWSTYGWKTFGMASPMGNRVRV